MKNEAENLHDQPVTHEALKGPFEHEICEKLSNFLLDKQEQERLEFANNPDMLFKLNVHFPSVYNVSKKVAPGDEIVHLAALYHDYGRVIQYRKHGDFNDRGVGSDEDHHVVGYKHFLQDIPMIFGDAKDIPSFAINEDMYQGAIYKASKAILLHGLKGKAFDDEFANLDEDTSRVVEIVSQIDDIANGTQCVEYILRESQEHAKNASRGGFIPDENQDLRTVTPKVMDLFRESTSFNRNAECKTYPDYCIFGAFLATRSLKNPATHDITHEMMSVPTTVTEHASIDGEDVLVSKHFDSAMEAFKYIFYTQMEEKDAEEAYSILSKYYNGETE